MDNQAFQQLVRDRVNNNSNSKSTREIAREAVEAEFAQRRQKRHRKNRRRFGDNDDDESSASSSSHRGRRDKRDANDESATQKTATAGVVIGTRHDKQSSASVTSKYRDRAKERREDKAALLQDVLPEPGKANDDDDDPTDREFDRVLQQAREFRSRPKIATTIRQHREDPNGNPGEDPTQVYPRNPVEARAFLNTTDAAPKSQLGKEIIAVLRQAYLSPADQITSSHATHSKQQQYHPIQRTTWTFSIQADPRRVEDAWEMPLERIYAAATISNDGDSTCPSYYSPLDAAWIAKIGRSLSAGQQQQKQQLQVSDNHLTNSHNNNNKLADDKDDEDDDDIFGSVGDYDPTQEASPTRPPHPGVAMQMPIASTANDTDVTGSTRLTHSIFGGLLSSTPVAVVEGNTMEVNSLGDPTAGTVSLPALRRQTAMTSRTRQFMSMSGGTADDNDHIDMDADFDGRFEPDEHGKYDDDDDAEKGQTGDRRNKRHKKKQRQQRSSSD